MFLEDDYKAKVLMYRWRDARWRSTRDSNSLVVDNNRVFPTWAEVGRGANGYGDIDAPEDNSVDARNMAAANRWASNTQLPVLSPLGYLELDRADLPRAKLQRRGQFLSLVASKIHFKQAGGTVRIVQL